MLILAACGTTSDDTSSTPSDNTPPSDQRGHHRGGTAADRSGGSRQSQAQAAVPSDPYERALQVKEKSGCRQAIPVLEPIAARGRGYEVAQFQLGECYIETAPTAGAARAIEETRAKGARFIVAAANAQLPSAQEQAVRLYLDAIGVAADPVEAGKWYLLLQRNPRRSLFGPAKIDAQLEARLRHDLTGPEWAKARLRADQWQPPE